MLVRGGSPLKGALSGLDGPTEEKKSHQCFVAVPCSSEGDSGRMASLPLGPVADPLPVPALA